MLPTGTAGSDELTAAVAALAGAATTMVKARAARTRETRMMPRAVSAARICLEDRVGDHGGVGAGDRTAWN